MKESEALHANLAARVVRCLKRKDLTLFLPLSGRNWPEMLPTATDINVRLFGALIAHYCLCL